MNRFFRKKINILIILSSLIILLKLQMTNSVIDVPLKRDIIVDNSVLSMYKKNDIFSYQGRYKCTNLKKATKPYNINDITVSLSSIPPRFSKLQLDQFSKFQQVILNIPKNFRRFRDMGRDEIRLSKNSIINVMDKDFGPGSKVVGLCGIIDKINDVILYLDDDILYDFENIEIPLDKLTEDVVISMHGGFYGDLSDKTMSLFGADLFEWAFGLPTCYTENDVLMGFSGVLITKIALERFCSTSLVNIPWVYPECYSIDDDWLSHSFRKIGLRLFSNRALKFVKDATQSDTDGLSMRSIYPTKRIDCLSQLRMKNQLATKTIIHTVFKEDNRLHDMKEYTQTFKIFNDNHKRYAEKFNYTYVVHENVAEHPAHWEKILILKNFLTQCNPGELLFYTDLDFIFLDKEISGLPEGKLISFSRGCDVDDVHIMAGNFISHCSKELISLCDVWLESTKLVRRSGELNDDQIALNIVYPRFLRYIFIDNFITYDFCHVNHWNKVGVHFPGTDKLNRLKRFYQKNS